MGINKKLGDFTGLAENYSKYRPSYSPMVLNALLGLINKEKKEIDFVDVGAGTGIWTRMVASKSLQTVTAIEPNEDMRHFGINDSKKLLINWIDGDGENTTLESNSVDIVTMASSFHWVDFEKGTDEFCRILRPNGIFCALWNPRKIEENPLLVEIENKLSEIAPHIKRVSSGRAESTEELFAKLKSCGKFEDVLYIEGEHKVSQSIEEYLGVWNSVNDIRAQAGEVSFERFMNWVEQRITGLKSIDTTYQTRAWVARVKIL